MLVCHVLIVCLKHDSPVARVAGKGHCLWKTKGSQRALGSSCLAPPLLPQWTPTAQLRWSGPIHRDAGATAPRPSPPPPLWRLSSPLLPATTRWRGTARWRTSRPGAARAPTRSVGVPWTGRRPTATRTDWTTLPWTCWTTGWWRSARTSLASNPPAAAKEESMDYTPRRTSVWDSRRLRLLPKVSESDVTGVTNRSTSQLVQPRSLKCLFMH